MNATQIKKKYLTYTKYKPSGIDWLGNIPEEWKIKRLKYYFNYHVSGIWGDEENGDENDMICIRVADFYFDSLGINTNNLTIRNIPVNQHSRILLKGDILLEKSGGGEKQPVGRAVRFNLDIKSVCSNFIERLIPLNLNESKYISYILGTMYFETINTRSIKQTTGIQNLDLYLYFCEFVPFPSIETKQLIAIFLDKENKKIDLLIEKKQKLIELLKEKRATLISQVITKGLDPQAELKSSGVDWLGYIPDDWKVKRLKDVTSINPETLSENTPSEYYLKYIDISNVDSEGKIIGIVEMYFENAPSRARRIVKKKDVIISTVRTYLKAISYLDNVEENTIVSTGFAVLRSKENILPNFLNYFVRCNNFIDAVMSHSEGVSYPAINPTILGGLKIFLSNIEQQKIIADFLDAVVNEINKAIEKIQQQIEFIKEYRMALITYAVTGKIMIN